MGETVPFSIFQNRIFTKDCQKLAFFRIEAKCPEISAVILGTHLHSETGGDTKLSLKSDFSPWVPTLLNLAE